MPRSVEIMNAGDLSGQGDVIMPRLRVLLKPTIEKTYHPVGVTCNILFKSYVR